MRWNREFAVEEEEDEEDRAKPVGPDLTELRDEGWEEEDLELVVEVA